VSAEGIKLRVFESPSGAQRLRAAEDFLRSLPRTERALFVAPSLGAASHLLARVLEPGQAVLGVHRHTLSTLASALSADALSRAELSRSTSLAALSVCVRLVDELDQEGRLGRFRHVATRPGFARSLARSIEELRCARVSTSEVAQRDPDLGALYERYVDTLVALKLADRAHVFELACAALGSHALRGLPLLWLDVRIRDRAEADLFAALVSHSAHGMVSLLHGDERTEGYVRGSVPHALVERARPEPHTDLELLQTRLFRTDARSESTPDISHGQVQILSAPGESREAVEVVRRVLAHAAAGVPFDRMAILLRASEGYRAVLAEALTRAEIPAHFADGVRRPDPAGRALLALLTCADEGLSARAFAEYLSLGVAPSFVPASVGPTAPDVLVNELDEMRLAPRHFERLLVDAAVIGGRARWTRRLAGLRASLSREVESLEADDPRRATLERDVLGLEALEGFALPILDALAALPDRGTWGAWIEALTSLAKLAIRDSEGLIEVLGELWPLSSVGPVLLGDVHRLLARRVGDVLVRGQGAGASKLFVGSIEDALGRTFDHVFVPGLAEKIFPPRVLEDPLLPDGLRTALGHDLLTTDERVTDERLLLRVAVGAATQALLLSYPRFDVEQGRPRVPSFYGLEVLRAVDGKLPAFDELARRADSGAAPRMGFPAPDDAQQAVDAAEFDLSTLQTLLSSNPEAQRGAARYLLSANATLARALRFRARRWTLSRFTYADGMVASESGLARTLLSAQRLAGRPYSTTALATFADCPYKFYLHAIVGLSPREEVDEVDTIDARQRGILFHAVQRATLDTLRREQRLPLAASELETAISIMRGALTVEGSRVREVCSPAIESVYGDTLRDVEHDLLQWLSRLAAEAQFTPHYFELGFGLPSSGDRDRASQSAAVDLSIGVRLRGAIDLVELARAPDAEGHPVLRATDHKTGEMPEERLGILNGGRTLQPVLYALSLETMFPEARVRSGRLYFCTSRGGFAEHEVTLDGTARAAARDLVTTIDRAVEQAFLPAAPRVKACETCAYQVVCGPYEEERVAQHKDQRALTPLFHVRALP